MVDKSWGVPGANGFRVRSNDRAAERAQAREERARERAGAVAAMIEERAAARAREAVEREAARVARRAREEQASAGDPHAAAAAARHRSSGRKDVVREQRDTRGYATVVDVERLRALADRGTSIAGLAGAFGITEAEVEAALAGK